MWRSDDKSISFAKKVKFGTKLFCGHNLSRDKGSNMATCSKCNAVFIVNCKYD